MTPLVDSVDWSRLRSVLGPSSEFVPGAIQRLVGSSTEAEATSAYWELDNRVVVQGELFESAAFVVGPLLAALVEEISEHARQAIISLMLQLAMGRPSEVEIRAGNEQIVGEIRTMMLFGMWTFYGLLDLADDATAVDLIDILNEIEVDRGRLKKALAGFSNSGRPSRARSHARLVVDGKG